MQIWLGTGALRLPDQFSEAIHHQMLCHSVPMLCTQPRISLHHTRRLSRRQELQQGHMQRHMGKGVTLPEFRWKVRPQGELRILQQGVVFGMRLNDLHDALRHGIQRLPSTKTLPVIDEDLTIGFSPASIKHIHYPIVADSSIIRTRKTGARSR